MGTPEFAIGEDEREITQEPLTFQEGSWEFPPPPLSLEKVPKVTAAVLAVGPREW